jgi:hypothetical protein
VKLPHREKAYIAPSKLADYLLSRTHPIGRWKARLFRAAGFDETSITELERALISIARSEEVSMVEVSAHGTKYVVEGAIDTPSGRRLALRTVWIVDAGTEQPRLVTAYPLGTREGA